MSIASLLRSFRTACLFALFPICLLSPIPVAAGTENFAVLKDVLQKRFTDIEIGDIRNTPLAGIYEVTIGTHTVLVSADGRYLIQGDLIDLTTRRNLTAEYRAGLIKEMIGKVSESDMIILGPAKAKYTLTVFTDVDCPYCARLHREVPKLNQAGVKVRYLLYPRAGPGTETYKRAIAVWCSKDRIQAIGIAKSGGKLEMKTCPNPVDRNVKLGAEVGVEGTPTIVFEDGRVVPGFATADRLLAMMGAQHGETSTGK